MAQLPSSVYAIEVRDDGPTAWFRLDEQAGSSVIVDAVGGVTAELLGSTPTFQATGLLPFDPGTAVTITEGATTRFHTQNNGVRLVGVDGFTFEFLFAGADQSELRVLAQALGQNPSNTVNIWINNDGTLTFGMTYSASGVFGIMSSSSSVVVADGNTHHVAITWEGSGNAPLVYVDGDDVTDTFGGDTFVANMVDFYIGNQWQGGDAAGGTIDEFAWYDYALSADRISAHADAVFAPWNGDTTGERVNRVLDVLGIPESERDVDGGESTLQSANIAGQSAGDHLRLVRDTEYGELFMTPDGKVRFISRHSRWKPPYSEPIGTFSDDGSDLGYGQLRFDYGDQLIRNRVTIGYENGASFTANSTDSQDDFLIQSYSKTGLIGDVDSEAVDYANYIRNKYDQPLLRVQGLRVDPQRDPATYFPIVLSADLVYQVNVERTPQGVGDPIDLTYTIEGISHHIEPKRWVTSFQLSPADTPGAFVLDSTRSGVLDGNALGF